MRVAGEMVMMAGLLRRADTQHSCDLSLESFSYFSQCY